MVGGGQSVHNVGCMCEGYSACALWTAVGNPPRLGLYTSELGTLITQCIDEQSCSDLWSNEGGALRGISNASFDCDGELACSFSSVAEGLTVHGLNVVCRSQDSCAFESILNGSGSVPSNVSQREVSVQCVDSESCVASERSGMFGWLRNLTAVGTPVSASVVCDGNDVCAHPVLSAGQASTDWTVQCGQSPFLFSSHQILTEDYSESKSTIKKTHEQKRQKLTSMS